MGRLLYRDRFIQYLQENIDTAAISGLLQTDKMEVPGVDIIALIERVEVENHSRLTAKSPKYFYTKLGNAIRRNITNDIDRRISAVVNHCIDIARQSAGRKPVIQGRRAYLLGKEFNKLADALKDNSEAKMRTATDIGAMMNLFFFSEKGVSYVAGYARNGGKFVRVIVRCGFLGKAFSARIKAPKIRPRNFDLVTIEIEGGFSVVAFEEYTFRYSVGADAVKQDLRGEFKSLEDCFIERGQAELELDSLQQVLSSLRAAGRGEKVYLSFTDGGETVKLTCGETTAYFNSEQFKANPLPL